MTGPARSIPRERAFRTIHAALVVGVLLFGALGVFLARQNAAALETFRLPLRVAGFLEVGFLIVAATLVRRTLAPLENGADRDAWWGANGPRVIVLWALAEGTALLGCVFWYLSRDPMLFAALTGVGLAVLTWSGPGRMTE